MLNVRSDGSFIARLRRVFLRFRNTLNPSYIQEVLSFYNDFMTLAGEYVHVRVQVSLGTLGTF